MNEQLKHNKQLIAERLQFLRRSRGWSKTYVAKMLGRTLSTYANWEYGTREPDIETLAKIARLYNVSIGYLAGVTDNPVEITKEEEEREKMLSKIENLELRRFVAEIPNAPIEDIQILHDMWQIIQKNKKEKQQEDNK